MSSKQRDFEKEASDWMIKVVDAFMPQWPKVVDEFMPQWPDSRWKNRTGELARLLRIEAALKEIDATKQTGIYTHDPEQLLAAARAKLDTIYSIAYAALSSRGE
jgi:hypothetical protein